MLGNGELPYALTIKAETFSKSAREKIEAAGGTIVEVRSAVQCQKRVLYSPDFCCSTGTGHTAPCSGQQSDLP